MKILFAIAHFYKPVSDNPKNCSLGKNPEPRIQALTQCILSLHCLFGKSQRIINWYDGRLDIVNQSQSHDIHIAICTTQSSHLLNELPIPDELFIHCETDAKPMLLGFECQKLMKKFLDKYDYYCFLEDDIILEDPWFFAKLIWFGEKFGNAKLLQPNRYEMGIYTPIKKLYIDGSIRSKSANKFQNIEDEPELSEYFLEQTVGFCRTLNPHSGCYFLNNQQLEMWVQQPYFLDYDISFVGPLESAATLGIMRAFNIYKPKSESANFLEVRHFGFRYLHSFQMMIGRSNFLGKLALPELL